MSDKSARTANARDAGSAATTVLIGMGSISGMDRDMWATPTDNVEVLIVHYPMEVERRCDDGTEDFEPVTITNAAELRRWAQSEFDHYDIRVP